MTIVNDCQIGGRYRIHREQIFNGGQEGTPRFALRQITNVLAAVRLSVDDHGNGVFEIAADGEDWLGRRERRNCTGCQATRSAQHHRAQRSHPHHRIVHSPRNRSFTEEKCIGHSGQARQCIVVHIGDRLAGSITARHHQTFRSA